MSDVSIVKVNDAVTDDAIVMLRISRAQARQLVPLLVLAIKHSCAPADVSFLTEIANQLAMVP